MKIKNFIQKSFQSAQPYEGIRVIEKRLIKHLFLVVIDDGSFLGVLTPEDLVKSPNRLVIDCLHKKPNVDIDQDIQSVIGLMKESKNSVLPVFKSDKFIGVVTRSAIADFLTEYQDELERKILERTAKLATANEQLKKEIYDRKKAQEALRASEAQKKAILDGIPLCQGSCRMV